MELCPVWYQYGLPHWAEDAKLKVVQGPKSKSGMRGSTGGREDAGGTGSAGGRGGAGEISRQR